MNEDWEDVSIKLNIEATRKEDLPIAAFHAPAPRVVLLSVNRISDLLKYQILGKRSVTYRFSSSVSDEGRGVGHHHVVVGVLKNMSTTQRCKIQIEMETGILTISGGASVMAVSPSASNWGPAGTCPPCWPVGKPHC